MPSRLLSEKQNRLFDLLAEYPSLVFALRKAGVSANIVGNFRINNLAAEARLDMGDGANHIHVDWSKVSHVEVGKYQGEGTLTFKNQAEEVLFKLYNIRGPFSDKVEALAGRIL